MRRAADRAGDGARDLGLLRGSHLGGRVLGPRVGQNHRFRGHSNDLGVLRPVGQGNWWPAVATEGIRQLPRQAIFIGHMHPVRASIALVACHALQQVRQPGMPRVRAQRRRGVAADRDVGRIPQGQSYLQTHGCLTSFRINGPIGPGLERRPGPRWDPAAGAQLDTISEVVSERGPAPPGPTACTL